VAVKGLQPARLVIRGHVGPLREGTKVKFTQGRPHPSPLPQAGEGQNGALPLHAMWFTRVSLKNPVFATMVMLAIVVLGLFSYQRLNIDQFPNIDFPVVVVTAEYPGASPEIVESEVSKKIEEGGQLDRRHQRPHLAQLRRPVGRHHRVPALHRRPQGRRGRAREDRRDPPTFRDEVKEPRVLRFDPPAAPIWSLAVLPDAAQGKAMSAVELTNWADQVLKKRLENVRGVGSVTLVGGTKREINIYLNPPAMERWASPPTRW
jgi:HAE1 family hydrophobic/amphiphilic exporter-1